MTSAERLLPSGVSCGQRQEYGTAPVGGQLGSTQSEHEVQPQSGSRSRQLRCNRAGRIAAPPSQRRHGFVIENVGEQRLALGCGQGSQSLPQGISLLRSDQDLIGTWRFIPVDESGRIAAGAIGLSGPTGQQVPGDHNGVPEGGTVVQLRARIQHPSQRLLDDVLGLVPVATVRRDVRAEWLDELEHIGSGALGRRSHTIHVELNPSSEPFLCPGTPPLGAPPAGQKKFLRHEPWASAFTS